MKKSEKILVSLVAVIGLYGLVEFSLRSLNTSSKPVEIIQTSTSNNLLDSISSELVSVSQTSNAHIAFFTDLIHKPWQSDAFLHGNKIIIQQKSSEHNTEVDSLSAQLNDQVQKFIYSAYLVMDNTTIAIIDGFDYGENESIDGFFIADISKDAIQLEKNGQTFTVSAKSETSTGKFFNTQTESNKMKLDNSQ